MKPIFLHLSTITLGEPAMRMIDKCLNCQERREIVSHGLCAKCLMRQRRAREKRFEPEWISHPDRSQTQQQRELNHMRVNFSRMLALLDDSKTSNLIAKDDEYQIVRDILITWIDDINKRQKLTVNPESELTVNSEDLEQEEQEGHELTVKSEKKLTVISNKEPEEEKDAES